MNEGIFSAEFFAAKGACLSVSVSLPPVLSSFCLSVSMSHDACYTCAGGEIEKGRES